MNAKRLSDHVTVSWDWQPAVSSLWGSPNSRIAMRCGVAHLWTIPAVESSGDRTNNGQCTNPEQNELSASLQRPLEESYHHNLSPQLSGLSLKEITQDPEQSLTAWQVWRVCEHPYGIMWVPTIKNLCLWGWTGLSLEAMNGSPVNMSKSRSWTMRALIQNCEGSLMADRRHNGVLATMDMGLHGIWQQQLLECTLSSLVDHNF